MGSFVGDFSRVFKPSEKVVVSTSQGEEVVEVEPIIEGETHIKTHDDHMEFEIVMVEKLKEWINTKRGEEGFENFI